ncbi:MAG: hypothetical protein C0603_13185 [Denitrovibrio sp.]|nr:MAG: hypothetical protein C0603_13185 [Denitrovibrio sp.]
MNNAFMVNDSISPSTQNKCCCKNSDTSDVFGNMFNSFLDSSDAEFSMTKIEISGTVMSNEELSLPDMENLEEVTERLQYLMDLMFVRNDIPTDPPVEIEYSYTRTEITVKGDREDINQISQLMNDNKEIKDEVKKINDIWNNFLGMYDALQSQNFNHDNPEVETAKEEYPDLFDEDGKFHYPKMSYGETITYFRSERVVQTYSPILAEKTPLLEV